MTDRRRPVNAGKGYDLAVIGAGSAGFSAAITAVEQGARVALVGHGTIGGTCVNVGCVPSKTLIRAAEALHQASAARRFAGIAARAQVEDWPTIVRGKDELVADLRRSSTPTFCLPPTALPTSPGAGGWRRAGSPWTATS
jgi:mercuric reductase